MSETQLRQNVRQTAVDAERHWWVQRLAALADRWTLEAAIEQRVSFCADDLRKVIAERSR